MNVCDSSTHRVSVAPWLIIGSLLALSAPVASAQNHVPNPSFERMVACGADIGWNLNAFEEWIGAANGASAMHACNDVLASTPSNQYGTAVPRSGQGYGAVTCYVDDPEYENIRSALKVPLAPLQAGQLYEIRMWVRLADKSRYAVDGFGIRLSAEDPGWTFGTEDHLFGPWEPHLTSSQMAPITDTDGWTLLSSTYLAEGCERWLLLGSHTLDDDLTVFDLDPGGSQGLLDFANYFVDDVSVVPVGATGAHPPSGLVAWYPFDDDADGVARDVFGAHDGEHDATLIGGVVDGALEFPGSVFLDRVVVPDDDALDFGLDDFSLDAWIRVDGLPLTGVSYIVSKMEAELTTLCGNPTPEPGWAVGVLSAGAGLVRPFLLLAEEPGPTLTVYQSSATITLGAWSLLAVAVDRDATVTFFVDGAVVDVLPLAPASATALGGPYPLIVGGHGCNLTTFYDYTFQGAIDELEVFRKALTPADVASLWSAGPQGKHKLPPAQGCGCVPNFELDQNAGNFQWPDGLMAFYTFDEPTGPVAEEYQGEHPGAYAGNPAPEPGVVGLALGMDGDDAVIIPHPRDFPLSADLTIEGWVRVDALPGAGRAYLVDKFFDPAGTSCAPSAAGFAFGVEDAGSGTARLFLVLSDMSALDSTYVSTGTFALGTWTHVSAAISRSSVGAVTFMIDGTGPEHQPLINNLPVVLDNTFDLTIGGRTCGAGVQDGLVGALDELRLHYRFVEIQEIRNLVAAGSAGYCRDDCNGNGIDDTVDIADGTSQDTLGGFKIGSDGLSYPAPDGIPDECQVLPPGPPKAQRFGLPL